MKQLKISKEISLPIDAVTQTISTIGRKGAGKTYLATMIAEQMIDAGAQIVVLDPVGNWWGLRVAADGKSKGKDIFIIGGDHGDVPIVPEAGNRIAKLLVEKGISAVLDISTFRIGERKRFCTDFGEEFLHLKKGHRSPVHIFIEEAQIIIPQRVGPEEARMVGAFEQIVRLGRNYGVGVTLVTQRPQSVNKEVLSQVECLCVLQVTGPHERKALEEWVQEAGADRKLVGELPGLRMGEGYVWSPSWLRIYQRVRFSTKQTFDASATPKVGEATKAAKLASVDVERLRSEMSEVVEQAERDDPNVLRRKIVELQRDLKNTQKTINPIKIEKIQIPAVGKKTIEGLIKIESGLRKILKPIKEQVLFLETGLEKLSTEIKKAERINNIVRPTQSIKEFIKRKEYISPLLKPRAEFTPPLNLNGELTGPEQRILNAIAWMESIGINEPEQTAIAFLADYRFGGGAFNNPRGSLRMKGLVEYVGNKIVLTESGRQVARIPEIPLTTEELHKKVIGRLPGPERKLLNVLLEVYPNEISNEELAERSGYTFGAGGFNNPRGRLRSLGLIEYVPGGGVKAKSLLFID